LKFIKSLGDKDLIEDHGEEDFKKIPEDLLIRMLKLPVPDEVVDKYLEKVCFFEDKNTGETEMRGKSTPDNWWSMMVFVYSRRREEQACSNGMPGRERFKEFVSGLKNIKAARAQTHGKDVEGKEAFTKKALLVIQQNSVNLDYTTVKQMGFCALLGSAAINTGLRIVFASHIAWANLSFTVSLVFCFIFLPPPDEICDIIFSIIVCRMITSC
jgi:hypothetical protein